jgi:LDH2 family malate/lactate/ureidoglycolate dehydrogenase
MKDVKEGIINFNDEPKILKEAVATAWVDGMNLLGPVVGNFCMNLAIEKAKKCGIGMVVAKRSNHYGIAGYYSMQALNQGFIVRFSLIC